MARLGSVRETNQDSKHQILTGWHSSSYNQHFVALPRPRHDATILSKIFIVANKKPTNQYTNFMSHLIKNMTTMMINVN